MFPTFLSLWCALSGKTPQRPAPRRRPAFLRPSCRPRLEVLEDRCLPAATLDPTFGSAGIVTTAVGGGQGSHALGDLLQPNGDIVAYGQVDSGLGLALERYTPSGSLDPTFGTGGIVWNTTTRNVRQAALQADGKIVVVNGGSPTAPQLPELVRYNSNGSLDTTFGANGLVTAPLNFSFASLLVLPSNGDIVVGGAFSSNSYALLCYTPNGTLDSTFGSGGEVVTPGLSVMVTSLALENGDIVAGGIATDTTGALARYTLSGTLDTTFGSGGIVTTPGSVSSLLVQPNGQIVAVGEAAGTSSGVWALARYNIDGTLDSTFGSGGVVTSNISGSDSTNGSALMSNGQIVVVGWSNSNDVFELGVYNPNGIPDPSFGAGGFVTTSWFAIPSAHGGGVVIQPDGKFVVATGADGNFRLARYLSPAPQTSAYFVITGSSSVTAGTPGNYAISVLNPDGSADTGYSGTVHITSSDPQAGLPANFSITGATATFSATLKTAGVQSLTATDTVTGSITGSDVGIQVNPGAATHLVLTGPSSVAYNHAFRITVTALDTYGNVATGYNGIVHFTDSTTGATLPANYTFWSSNGGAHTFTRLKLRSRGWQTITVIDTLVGSILGTLTIDVT